MWTFLSLAFYNAPSLHTVYFRQVVGVGVSDTLPILL